MRPCKRIEIVLERSHAERLARVIREAGAPGFTVLHHAGGGGDRGYRRADDLTDTDENAVFIIAVESDQVVQAIVEGVQPMLQRLGGICLVSDAMMATG